VKNFPAGQQAPRPPGHGDNRDPAGLSPAVRPAPASGLALWRPIVTGTASLGAPAGIGVLDPLLGEMIIIIEIMVALMVIAVALFGSKTLSERGFRLLRWFGNRPEPPAPD
jgi:hypothetical protein